MVEEYLKQLMDELKWEASYRQDESKVFHFTLSDTIILEMKDLNPGVYFFTQIAPCPDVKREDLFILLMKANLLGQGTGGSTIALDPDGNILTLALDLPYDLNFKTFKEALEDFVNYSEYWKGEIEKHKENAAQMI